MKTPSLGINPQLTTSYDRERWINEAYEKNGSESARESRKSILSRLDHYCHKIHQMPPEEIFLWMKKESKKTDEPTDTLTQYAIDFLSRYVKFCQIDHKDIIIKKGTKNSKINKKNYLHKLHNNSILGVVSRSRQFMSQVGGIRVHDDDMKRIPFPNTVKRGLYDDEEAEPLTAEQARSIIEIVKFQRSVALYHFMNDTGFRISEAGNVKDSDFDFYSNPPSVKNPSMSVKGVLSKGVRYMRSTTAYKIKAIIESNKHYVFRSKDSQTLDQFRKSEYHKIKKAYKELGMTSIYDDTGRSKYNLHSWRKRCATEYGRNNSESLTDGYLRHSKYLAQYHQKTKEERIEAFKRAEIDLAIDEIEKLKVKNSELQDEKSELQALQEKFKPQLDQEEIIKRLKEEILADWNNPNRKVLDITDEKEQKKEISKMKRQFTRIKKDVESK